jgi:hypothetical protein
MAITVGVGRLIDPRDDRRAILKPPHQTFDFWNMAIFRRFALAASLILGAMGVLAQSGGNAQDAAFINHLFTVVTGGPADGASLSQYETELASEPPVLQSVFHLVVAQSVVASPAAIAHSVALYYNSLLGRDGTPAEIATGVAFVTNGATVLQFRALIQGGAEYFSTRAGGQLPGYVAAVFQDDYHRNPTDAESQSLVSQIGVTTTRSGMAKTVGNSTESLNTWVADTVMLFLGRAPTSTELTTYSGDLKTGQFDFVLAQILGSDEFYNLSQTVSVAPPTLTIAAGTSGNVVVSWPSSATGYGLQSAPSIGASAVWSAVAGTPTLANNAYSVTLAIGPSPLFFRLVSP